MFKKLLLLISCLSCIYLTSCRKVIEKQLQDPKSYARMSSGGDGELIVDVQDDDTTYNQLKYTRVGAQYTFPFKTDILRQAWNNLSPNHVDQITPSHNYIKFTPHSLEEYVQITNSGLKTFDFPLDHEILEYGDQIENTPIDGLPALYTFVPINTAIPSVTHEVLFPVRFIPIESKVAEEAFNICGLSEKYPYYRENEANPQFDDITGSIYDLEIRHTGWDVIEPSDDEPFDGGNGGYNNGELNFNTPTPSDVTNACGCQRNSDDRMPSGCVLVEETQFAPNWQGVRNVMVDFVGPFGQYQVMNTNAWGCFRSDAIMRHKVWRPFASELRLPVVMRVIFTSGKLTVRSLIPGTVALASNPVCHIVGDVAPWGLNNITIRYNRATNALQVPCVYYNSASINNAHYEVTEMASDDGLGTSNGIGRRKSLPSDMAYLVHPFNGRSGSAMMMRQLMKSGNPVTQFNQARIQWIFHAIPALGFNIESYLRIAPPDIAFGIDHGGAVQSSSDLIRWVFYHEMGHAMHYKKSGSTFYQKLVNYEVNQTQQNGTNNDPYGDGTANNAGVCALAETWAEHIGLTYVHRRYGVNHIFGGATPRDRIENSYYGLLERTRDGGSGGSWNYTWIPKGLLHDLMDNNVQNNQPPNFVITENPAIGTADDVGGFTNLRFYDELDADDMNDFINRIRTNQLPATGNSVNSYNTLVNAYGY